MKLNDRDVRVLRRIDEVPKRSSTLETEEEPVIAQREQLKISNKVKTCCTRKEDRELLLIIMQSHPLVTINFVEIESCIDEEH